jgi:hypothetical protein
LAPTLDPAIRFLVSVPDSQPEQATPFQGFAPSLCKKFWLLGFINQMPADIFELEPDNAPYRLAARIAGRAQISWYAQSPRALRASIFRPEVPFTVVILDETENLSDYPAWMGLTPGISPMTLVAKEKGHIRYSDLSLGALQARFLTICDLVGPLGVVEGVDEARSAIASWIEPPSRQLSYEVGGHGTIFPNAAVLRACGFTNVGAEPFARFREGEKAHLDQIVLTTDSIFTEREANPPSLGNSIYPRMPDLNVYCPATRDLKSAISPSEISDQAIQRLAETALRILNKQSSYSYEISSETQFRAVFVERIDGSPEGRKAV